MKKYIIMIVCVAAAVSCDYLDTRYDTDITQYNVDNEYTRIIPVGYAAYGYMKNGLSELDDKALALAFRLIPKDKAAEVFSNMDTSMQTYLVQVFTEKELILY